MIRYKEQIVVQGWLFLDDIETDLVVRNRKSRCLLMVEFMNTRFAYGDKTQFTKKTFICHYYVIYERVINI